MAKEIRTTLVVAASAQGFEQITQRLAGLNEAANKAAAAQAQGFKDAQADLTKFKRTGQKLFADMQAGFDDLSADEYRKTLDELQDHLRELAKEQLATIAAMEKVDDATDGYQELAKYLQEIEQDSQKAQRAMNMLTRAFKDQARAMEGAQRASGSFTQGFLQGALPQGFIQRGPGAWRQAAGVMAGRGVGAMGGVGRGLAATPFTGGAGLSQALASIPGVGGLLAGQFQTGMGFAQTALQAQQTRLGLAPYMGGAFGSVEQARARATRGYLGRTSGNVMEAYAGLGGAGSAAERGLIDALDPTDPNIQGQYSRMRAARARRAGGRAAARTRRGVMSPIRAAGAGILGVGEMQATQQAMAMLQAGGGTYAELQDSGMLEAGFAGMQRFGLDAGTTGAFFQAGRAGGGGLTGAQGRPAAAMTKAIGDAMSMGLQGSEITQYMQQMAAGIQQWQQTGIPINAGSIGSMGRTVAAMGLGGTRGAAVAQGVQRAGQRISQTGVTSAADMLMLQTMGGFRGGGLEEYEQAMLNLEQGMTEKGGLQRMFKQLMGAGGGGAAGRLTFRRAMGQMGVGVGLKETRLLEKQMRGEKLTEEEQRYISGVEEQMRAGAAQAPKTPEQLIRSAQDAVSGWAGDLRRYNTILNKQIDIGQKLTPVMLNLEDSSKRIAGTFADFAGKPLEQFTTATNKLTKEIESLSSAIQSAQSGSVFDFLTGG